MRRHRTSYGVFFMLDSKTIKKSHTIKKMRDSFILLKGCLAQANLNVRLAELSVPVDGKFETTDINHTDPPNPVIADPAKHQYATQGFPLNAFADSIGQAAIDSLGQPFFEIFVVSEGRSSHFTDAQKNRCFTIQGEQPVTAFQPQIRQHAIHLFFDARFAIAQKRAFPVLIPSSGSYNPAIENHHAIRHNVTRKNTQDN